MTETTENLERIGLFFDDLHKIKIVHPTSVVDCTALKEESGAFTHKVDELNHVVGKFMHILSELSDEVEHNKMRAIAAKNAISNVQRQDDMNKQQLIIVLTEKTQQLERYRKELEALKKIDEEQTEQIQQLQ